MYKHKYMPLSDHLAVAFILAATALSLLLCYALGIEDITGILLLPILFVSQILRCIWDIIYIIAVAALATAEYIFANKEV